MTPSTAELWGNCGRMTPAPCTAQQLQILEERLIWLSTQASNFIRHNATLRKGYAAQADAVRIQIERLKRTIAK